MLGDHGDCGCTGFVGSVGVRPFEFPGSRGRVLPVEVAFAAADVGDHLVYFFYLFGVRRRRTLRFRQVLNVGDGGRVHL